MRLLYIVPKIKNAGGVARVLSLKANYFIEKFNYEVQILSQNEDDDLLFYDFNSQVVFHNIILGGNAFQFLKAYQNQINQKIKEIQPDIVLVADNGLKAFIFPFIIKTKIPVVFECHGSKFIEEQQQKKDFFSKSIQRIKYQFKTLGARRFTKMVALSSASLEEWNVNNGVVISNPSWIKTENPSTLKNKKVIAVARNSYEKGLDRLLLIWEKAVEKHSEWILDIYTDEADSLRNIVVDLGLKSNVNIFSFVKNIEEKYQEASIYAMTSRSEGFPMVLLEAMAFGLPCIAYDCPIGPGTIITNDKNGFLITENDFDLYIEKLSFLIENEEIRLKLGSSAKETAENFSIEKIMEKWKQFFEGLQL